MFLLLGICTQYCGCGLTTFDRELWLCSLITWFWWMGLGALWSPQLKLSSVAVRLHGTGLEMSTQVGVIESAYSMTVVVSFVNSVIAQVSMVACTEEWTCACGHGICSAIQGRRKGFEGG